jgi:hypothetical protein
MKNFAHLFSKHETHGSVEAGSTFFRDGDSGPDELLRLEVFETVCVWRVLSEGARRNRQ